MLTQSKLDDSKEEIFTVLHQLSTYLTFGSAEKYWKQSFWLFDFTRPLQDFELLNISKPISVDRRGRGGSSNRKLRLACKTMLASQWMAAMSLEKIKQLFLYLNCFCIWFSFQNSPNHNHIPHSSALKVPPLPKPFPRALSQMQGRNYRVASGGRLMAGG